MQGWIKLHRQIREHGFFKEQRRFSKFEAWIDILLRANHKETEILMDYKLVKVKPGQFITSEVKLSNDWNWNRKTVRKFLTMLESEEMILKKGTARWTSITVAKWASYQSDGQLNGQGVGQGVGQAMDRGLDTDKNVKNDKNEKKNNRGKFIPPSIDEIKEYCKERNNNIDAEQFHDFYSSKNWFVGKNKMKDWKAAVRTWERNNKKEEPRTTRGSDYVRAERERIKREAGL